MPRSLVLFFVGLLISLTTGGLATEAADRGASGRQGAKAAVANKTPARCTIKGTGKDDRIHGTPRDDVICARGGDDHVSAGRGDDIIYLGKGQDWADGGPGNDVIYGGNQSDTLNGGAGDDVVYAGPGDDYASGGGRYPCCGQDEWVDGGNDLLVGGRGNDWCLAVKDGAGNDTALGGPGFDTSIRDRRDRVTTERTAGEGCPG